MKRSLILAAAAAGSLVIGLGGLVWAQQAPQPPAPPTPGHDGGAPGMHHRGPHMGGPRGPMGPMRMHGGPGGLFSLLEFDANTDGKLTKAEFDAAQHARFNEMDANKDGFVVADEMKAYRQKVRADAEAARFQLMDTDHNGQISKAEFDTAHKEGAHAGGPMHMGPPGGPAHAMMMMRGHGGFGPRPGHDGKPGDGQKRQADASGPHRAGPLDSNGDGKLSFEEFAAGPGRAFARADVNKDNVVTIAELQTLTKAMR